MNMLKQVRKALNDIQAAFTGNHPNKAEYQVYLLRKMIDEEPSRQLPWSYYQPLVDEEFGE